jgi:hypothetical protein
MLTCDQNLSYQQNLATRRLALIVLSTNNWSIIKTHIEEILSTIDLASAGSFVRIEIPKIEKPLTSQTPS